MPLVVDVLRPGPEQLVLEGQFLGLWRRLLQHVVLGEPLDGVGGAQERGDRVRLEGRRLVTPQLADESAGKGWRQSTGKHSARRGVGRLQHDFITQTM